MRSSIILLFVMFGIAAYGGDQADQISLPRQSTTGLEGWTRADYRHSNGSWMNRFLVVKTKKGKIKTFAAEYAFIVGWNFCRGDSCVVIQSENSHGPYYWQLFDVASGQLLDSFFAGKADTFPEWAHRFVN
jgi:hypothetical protein